MVFLKTYCFIVDGECAFGLTATIFMHLPAILVIFLLVFLCVYFHKKYKRCVNPKEKEQ